MLDSRFRGNDETPIQDSREHRLPSPALLQRWGEGTEVYRPKLSDPAREEVRLQPERDGRVRCSALGRWCAVLMCPSELCASASLR
jgi:hypothetical protein